MPQQTINSWLVGYENALLALCQNLTASDRQLVMEYACALICRQRLRDEARSRVLPFRIKLPGSKPVG